MDKSLVQDAFVFVTIIVGMGCFTGIVMQWLGRRAPKADKLNAEVLRRLDEIADRFARLDNSVDAVAVEVERISEAQRFTSKLLAERPAASVPERVRPAGTTTPH